MDASEENDDLFADLYGEDEPTKDTTNPNNTTQATSAPAPAAQIQPVTAPESSSFNAEPVQQAVDPRQPQSSMQSYQSHDEGKQEQHSWDAPAYSGDNVKQEDQGYQHQSHGGGNNGYVGDHASGSPAIKEDGKMFIGGLNWETTDESLKDYFSQFGEVVECTVMRDGPTGRSRGFGFLTFKDPKTVNIVMVKEHFLDGKIIDPKRAIPRDEQEKTSKIFVGGVSQEATETDFREYFMQFGRVLDSTLMMDKDTGRPRGFGFVTFDSEAAVENALSHPNLEILGKAIEVKKAQPRGKTLDNDRDGGFRDRGHHNRHDGGGHNNFHHQQGPQNQQQMPSGPYNGLSPQMMMQYFQNMQRYMAAMSQQMAAGRGNGQSMPMPAFNPAMMNPAMIQQMQMMQARMMSQQQPGMGGPGGMGAGPQGSVSPPQGFNSPAGHHGGFNQQQQGGFDRGAGGFQGHQNQRDFQGPSQQQGSWEGMYDDVPQQQQQAMQGQMGGHHGVGPIRTGTPNNHRQGPAGPPPNAPTGPKSQRPTGNFRGAGRGVMPGRGGPVGRGYGGAGYHPYARSGH